MNESKKVAGNGERHRRVTDINAIWKWIAASLFALVMLLSGAFLGDFAASVRYSGLHSRMTDHERIDGHPVMVEKVGAYQDSVNRQLSRIEEKLERQSVVLREIEQQVSSHAAVAGDS